MYPLRLVCPHRSNESGNSISPFGFLEASLFCNDWPFNLNGIVGVTHITRKKIMSAHQYFTMVEHMSVGGRPGSIPSGSFLPSLRLVAVPSPTPHIPPLPHYLYNKGKNAR